MTTTIRLARHSDISSVEAIISRSAESGDLLPRTRQELLDHLPTFFVAEMCNGQIVGTASLEIYSKKLAEIRSLCTVREVRGLGIGKALVNACINLARVRGVFEVMVVTDKIAFFKSCGFNHTLPNQREALFIATREYIEHE